MLTDEQKSTMDGTILNNYPYFEDLFNRWYADEDLSKVPADMHDVYRSILIKGWNAAIMRNG